MSKKQETQREQQECLTWLKKHLVPNHNIYCFVMHVSSSGMSRVIKTCAIIDGELMDISYYVAKTLGWRLDKHGRGVIVQGCGMDMCFHTIYELSYAVFGLGYSLTHRIP